MFKVSLKLNEPGSHFHFSVFEWEIDFEEQKTDQLSD